MQNSPQSTGLAHPDPPQLPKGERRRRSLLDAALRVIAENGVDAVTHRRVAAEAGVSHGTANYHFTSRDAIVFEAFRHYIANFSLLMTQTLDDGPALATTPAEIVDFIVRVIQREFADPDLVLAEYELILYAARNEELAAEYRAWERSLVAHLAESLENCGADRPMHAARIVLGVSRAFEFERLTHPEIQIKDLRERLTSLLSSLC